MKKLIGSLAAFALIGCGGGYSADKCELKFASVSHSNAERTLLHAQWIEQNIQSAHDVLVSHGLIPETEICGVFKTVNLHLLDELGLDIPFNSQKQNLTLPDNIWLGYDQRYLAHEMLHIWDLQHFSLLTVFHYRWEELGYNRAQTDYECRALWAVDQDPGYHCVGDFR